MSKKAIIILISGTILIAVGILFFVISSKNKNASSEEEKVSIRDFLPFGSSSKNDENIGGDTEEENEDEDENVFGNDEGGANSNLREITTSGVAGSTIFLKEILKDQSVIQDQEVFSTTPNKNPSKPETELVPAIRYVDQATGHIYEMVIDKDKSPRKISNTTIPKVHEAIWADNGNKVIYRYLSENNIVSFLGKLRQEVIGGDSTETQPITGEFLPQNIDQITVSPDTKKVFYLTRFGSGSAGTIFDLGSNKKTSVFSSELREWLPYWTSKSEILLTTKPAAKILGYAFRFNHEKNTLDKALGGLSGLTSIGSSDGKYIIFSKSENNGLELYSYNTSSGKIISLGVSTLAEKCIFSKNNIDVYCGVPNYINETSYPDYWYQGIESFADSLWKINAETGNTELLSSVGDKLGKDIDMINLGIDGNGEYLIFTNKASGFLYSYKL